MFKVLVMIVLMLVQSACVSAPDEPSDARSAIQASLDRTVRATIAQDIDAYMAELPPDFALMDEGGERISRETQKAHVLRDWSVIPRTLALEHSIDSIEVKGDVATVHTSQKWKRLMLRPDRSGTDEILTTQRHRETWRRLGGRWYGFDVVELGGEILVNGRPYTP